MQPPQLNDCWDRAEDGKTYTVLEISGSEVTLAELEQPAIRIVADLDQMTAREGWTRSYPPEA